MKDLMEQQVRLARWLFFHFLTEQGEGEQLKKSPLRMFLMLVMVMMKV